MVYSYLYDLDSITRDPKTENARRLKIPFHRRFSIECFIHAISCLCLGINETFEALVNSRSIRTENRLQKHVVIIIIIINTIFKRPNQSSSTTRYHWYDDDWYYAAWWTNVITVIKCPTWLQWSSTNGCQCLVIWLWSLVFSATPSAAIACLSLATARLGSIGAWQSGNFIFHLHFICRTTWCNTVIQMFGISPCHDGGDDVVLCLCDMFLCRHGLSTCGINSGMDGSCHWWNWCWFHVDSTRCVLCTMCWRIFHAKWKRLVPIHVHIGDHLCLLFLDGRSGIGSTIHRLDWIW